MKICTLEMFKAKFYHPLVKYKKFWSHVERLLEAAQVKIQFYFRPFFIFFFLEIAKDKKCIECT